VPEPDRTLWWLRAVLPRGFRERVVEPALSDLRLAELEGGRRWTARVALVAECIRIGLPQYLWQRRRPTKFAVVLGAAAVVVALGAARLRYAERWRDEPARKQTR
jgi:hypothetical protein